MANLKDDLYNEFNKAKHFRAKIKWDEIEALSGPDFLWEVLEPISLMIKDEKHELTRVKRLSPHQKALHFFWYLDDQVTNGGFIQFYWNGYERYIPAIIKGLELMGYTKLLKRVIKAEEVYEENIDKFSKCQKKGNFNWLYDNLKDFEKLDNWYFKNEEQHYAILEQFVREHIDEFIIKT